MARKSTTAMEKTKQCLLENGLFLLQKRGYNATGIQEIATLSNIPKGSFYNYFPSKEAFGVAVIHYYAKITTNLWRELLATPVNVDNPCETLSSSFLAITQKYYCTEIKKGCLLGTLSAELSEASEECRTALKEAIEQFKIILIDCLNTAQQKNKIRRDIPAENLADLIWDCWQGSMLNMRVKKSIVPVQQNLNIIFKYLLCP
ncbi:TetR/AcrR family transcriptional regulator [Pectinatus sottacetonis]|uniref:TetR/AcrR family transcriptional regulator n=1 Tax=Pectinatus sottacetonis TaxID=1002795 RepID=UPI0018C71FBD|nr:TetR/AcrR family transcriptional regulator [Pectinatus sottacetonis]